MILDLTTLRKRNIDIIWRNILKNRQRRIKKRTVLTDDNVFASLLIIKWLLTVFNVNVLIDRSFYANGVMLFLHND